MPRFTANIARFRRCALLLFVILCGWKSSYSQDFAAVPNRPSASTTAETVAPHVFEIEYGTELAAGKQDINGLNKFGATENLELKIGNMPWQRDTTQHGIGDTSLGFKYRFSRQKEGGARPSIALLYSLNLPTASSSDDTLQHFVGVALSKDIGSHHLDFNEAIQWSRRADRNGFDHNYFSALCYSRPLSQRFGWSEEISGWTAVDRATPGSLSLLSAVTFNLTKRLVLDSGVSITLAGPLPRTTYVGGVTYSVVRFGRKH